MAPLFAIIFSVSFSIATFAQTPAPQLTQEDRMNLSKKVLTIDPVAFKSVKLDLNPDEVDLISGYDLECEPPPSKQDCLDKNNEGMIFE